MPKFLMILLVLSAAVVLTGCGGSNSNNPTPTVQPQPNPTTTSCVPLFYTWTSTATTTGLTPKSLTLGAAQGQYSAYLILYLNPSNTPEGDFGCNYEITVGDNSITLTKGFPVDYNATQAEQTMCSELNGPQPFIFTCNQIQMFGMTYN